MLGNKVSFDLDLQKSGLLVKTYLPLEIIFLPLGS